MSSLVPNDRETVTSIGSAWIICRSKSFARRIYYFNTLTGEAVWNLSETKVERAKHKTKILQRQTDFVIDNNGPEPPGPPKDDPSSNKLPSSSINQFPQHNNMVPANQQVINNRFPSTTTLCTPHQYHACNPMNPIQCNIPVAPVRNPPIWNADPQQIFVTPTYRQIQPFTSNNNYNHVYENNMSNTPSSSTGLSTDDHANEKIQIRHNKYQHHKSPKNCGVEKNKNKIDLRLLLSLKKIENQLKEKVSQLRTNAAAINSNKYKLNEEDWCSTAWLEAKLNTQRDINSSERKASTSSSQVKENTDVTNIIVSDSNVFLRNINLLNDILNTDEECCLLVPKIIMEKIKDATKSSCRVLAYKALYFIWQHYEENRAIIEEESEENESTEDDILSFCRHLIEISVKEIRVILLTDDTELINSNNAHNTNIRIMTTMKMQHLVDEYKCNETTTTNIDTQELAHVNTIIENESNIQHNEKVIKSPMRKCMNFEKSFGEKQAKSSGADNVFQKDKKTCDVGVQTSCNLPSVFSQCNTDVRDEVLLPDSTKANDNVPRKTGEIKLKLNFSTDQKKKSCQSIDRTKAGNGAESTYPVTDSTVNENTVSDGKKLIWSLFSNTCTDLYKMNEGCDTSSIVFINEIQPESIAIEDSNSVISKTTSNVDTDSERGAVQKANTNIDDGIVMFEVSDSRMEEALRVKMDEWVSRFVQIMEEALSQLLEREPTFALETMPPPWTLHEAAECVRKHFCHDLDVLTAAERLLAVSRDHGGLRGKIKCNISPHKYMELYSYGVYLIDALQGVLGSNEDLQMASEALSELMNHIQQSHSEPGAQDSFTDISAEECDAIATHYTDTCQVEANQGAKKQVLEGISIRNNKKQSTTSTPSAPGKYDLGSQRKKNFEILCRQLLAAKANVKGSRRIGAPSL